MSAPDYAYDRPARNDPNREEPAIREALEAYVRKHRRKLSGIDSEAMDAAVAIVMEDILAADDEDLPRSIDKGRAYLRATPRVRINIRIRNTDAVRRAVTRFREMQGDQPRPLIIGFGPMTNEDIDEDQV